MKFITIILNVCERLFYGISKVKYFMDHGSWYPQFLSLVEYCFFFLYSIYWLSTIFVVVPVFHETICIFYMEFNSHSCPERKERKTEILNYCRCQSPLRTVIPFISTLNWIYFHFIHLFMVHEKLLLIFLHRFEHRAELLVAPLVCIYDVSDIHKCGTPQSKSLTFHTEIHQETKWGKH